MTNLAICQSNAIKFDCQKNTNDSELSLVFCEFSTKRYFFFILVYYDVKIIKSTMRKIHTLPQHIY